MKGFFLLAGVIIMQVAQAKSILVPLTTNHLSGKEKKYADIIGGDTLMLETGERGAIQFADFTSTNGKYITIINGNGLCQVKSSILPYGISIRNCHYIKLCGNGSENNKYGIKIAEVTLDGAGLGISDKSDHIEVCFIEIANTKGPGILCKTNPTCFTSRDNFSIVTTSIHNNYIHHTGTEGMYIGSTAFEGEKIKCDSVTVTRFPPILDSVEVFENIVNYTGWDGIQISYSTHVNCYSNKILYDSQKDQEWQNCGLIIGGGTSGRFYKNTIEHGKGYGINCFGTGNVEIEENTIIMDSTSTKVAVYINDKLTDANAFYKLQNNSITTSSLPAIKLVNNKRTKPDLLIGNKLNNGPVTSGLSYEGTKPEVR